jgi:hypothetical protein
MNITFFAVGTRRVMGRGRFNNASEAEEHRAAYFPGCAMCEGFSSARYVSKDTKAIVAKKRRKPRRKDKSDGVGKDRL